MESAMNWITLSQGYVHFIERRQQDNNNKHSHGNTILAPLLMPDQRQWDIRLRPTEGCPSRLHEGMRMLTDLLSPMVSISSSFLIADSAFDHVFHPLFSMSTTQV